jgi:hypothetical protein
MQINNTISSTITENYIRYFINSCGEDYRKDGDWWHSSNTEVVGSPLGFDINVYEKEGVLKVIVYGLKEEDGSEFPTYDEANILIEFYLTDLTFSGLSVPTKENWKYIADEFGFECNETGCVLEDGTVFYDHKGLDHYIFANKDIAADYFFNGMDVECQHSFYIGSRDEHPTLDGWCKRMGIALDTDEDGSSVFSAYKQAIK